MKRLLLVWCCLAFFFCNMYSQEENLKTSYQSFKEAMKESKEVKFLILDSVDQYQIKCLKEFQNLERLMIKNFSLDTLSNEILHCRKLREIGIYNSNIHFLPQRIDELENLELILIFDTSLKSLPTSLFELEKLKLLYLYMTEIPDSILYNLDDKLKIQTTIVAKDYQVQGKLE